MLIGHVDWGATAGFAGVAVIVIGAALRMTITATQIADRVAQQDKQIEKQNAQIDKIARHLDGVMASLWPTLWRVSGLEENAHEHTGYKIPSLVPPLPDVPPFTDDDDRDDPGRSNHWL